MDPCWPQLHLVAVGLGFDNAQLLLAQGQRRGCALTSGVAKGDSANRASPWLNNGRCAVLLYRNLIRPTVEVGPQYQAILESRLARGVLYVVVVTTADEVCLV